MITKEQLRFVFWPWGEVKRLRREVKDLEGKQADIQFMLPGKLFWRIESLRQQLRESENENSRLQAENTLLRQQLPPPK